MANYPDNQLIDCIKDAHAIESSMPDIVESMLRTTRDQEIARELDRHKENARRHQRLLAERLAAHGVGPSTLERLTTAGGALSKGVIDAIPSPLKDLAKRGGAVANRVMGTTRGETPSSNARDRYVVEHYKIALYELLERFAAHAGDQATADVARRNRADEEAMARGIASNWDRLVELTIREEEAGA